VSKKKERARREALTLLTERFPQCFSVEGRREPLKVGIHADILAALDGAIGPDELRRVLAAYTGHSTYLRGVVSGAYRRDLDGKPASVVTTEEEANAKAKLAGLAKSRQAVVVAPLAPPMVPEVAAPAAATNATAIARRLSLAALREAGRRRRESTG
jgi:sRNA-binding protein